MFAGGIVDEAVSLAARYGRNHEALTGNIYPIIHRLIDGEVSENEAKGLFIIKDRQLAKKQITWLKKSLPDAGDTVAFAIHQGICAHRKVIAIGVICNIATRRSFLL